MARVPSRVGTRKRISDMLAGETGEMDTSAFVRQAVRLMIEEAREAEVSERVGRGYDERGRRLRRRRSQADIAMVCGWDA